MLSPCPDCKAQMSSRAAACPACGWPNKAVTIEKTSKWLKAQLAASILIFLAGLTTAAVIARAGAPGWMDAEPDLERSHWTLLALAATVFGGCWFIWVRVRIWWHHG